MGSSLSPDCHSSSRRLFPTLLAISTMSAGYPIPVLPTDLTPSSHLIHTSPLIEEHSDVRVATLCLYFQHSGLFHPTGAGS